MLFEALTDAVKPALPPAARPLPWLLAAPFRYGRSRPSRFRAADTLPGIHYASESIETAVTEAAYWRLAGFAQSPGFQRPRTPTPMSALSVLVDTPRAIDLTTGPLSRPAGRWTHPSDYTVTHTLGAAARAAGLGASRGRHQPRGARPRRPARIPAGLSSRPTAPPERG